MTDYFEKIHRLSIDILNVFEDLLDKHDIYIPDVDRTGANHEACLYGETYAELQDEIESILRKENRFNDFDVTPKPRFKPCPFCGGKADIYKIENGMVGVECKNEKCVMQPMTPAWLRVNEATKAWNRRVRDEQSN